jgi:hypothetical protein
LVNRLVLFENLCKGHLAEKNVAQQNKIKCGDCKKDFKVRDNEFRTINIVNKLLDDHGYLNDEEISLKKKIEDSIRTLFQMYELFTLNKTNRDLDVHNHFQEIRRNIDLHRETLKEKIDYIYMDLIEKTKKFEAAYLKSLEEHLEASLKSFEMTSLEQSLKETEETFRDPNLLIDSIREMLRQQEETIVRLTLKLNEQSQVKDNLINMNEFNPNLSFSLESFGQLYLNEYSSIDPFMSQILSGKQPSELIKVCEFSLKDKWTLLYRGTRDDFAAANFHTKCDGHPNTLTLLKANGTSYIFGGFTSITWNGSFLTKSDPSAFLFSLTNKDNQPYKMKQINTAQSIYCRPDYGPIFGFNDFYICDSANTTPGSGSNLGDSYEHPQPDQGRSYLAGSEYFQLSEIEVYQKE